MCQYKEITTLQYMGSKSRILSHICDPIIKNAKISEVVDLFAGTGSVGYALKDYKKVISNDIEYYSYIINQAILNGCVLTVEDELSFWNTVEDNYEIIKNSVDNIIDRESYFFTTQVNYKEYRIFCETTPSVFNPDISTAEFNQLHKLVCNIVPGQSQNIEFPCLFLTYYANAYFGIKQCCQIDAIRGAINTISDKSVQNVLLTVLMSVMSSVASTTTHFAQYLKVKSVNTCKNLIEKRKKDIFSSFRETLNEYRSQGLCNMNKERSSAKCYNMDFSQCLDSITLNGQTLVYADPPYFKEHYSRYYHILNTLCKYDYPAMSINPQTHQLSIGRYRDDRTISDFGKKAKALEAFRMLIKKCFDSSTWLMISYSDNSIVEITDLQKLAEQYYQVEIKKIGLNHSKQGRSSTSKVDEYIFICCPYKQQSELYDKLNAIKKIKPIVDNPAGLMHNYMARKPYNVVSEIIRQFCPEDGCVYDPMFGSGTTLIEASKLGRKAIGTDINVLAYKLCKVSLTKWDIAKLNTLIDLFCDKIVPECEMIYSFDHLSETRVIERCHFDWNGENLVPTSYWYKVKIDNKFSGRRKDVVSDDFLHKYDEYSNYIPKHINNSGLIPNSRIAIGNNDDVFMYFCNRNLIVLDKILGELYTLKNEYGYEVLEIMVSSAINLIKLSDKKASSQMPYWLPKKDVTSRNACVVLRKKAEAFKQGLQYLSENCKQFITDDLSSSVRIQNIPAQDANNDWLPDKSVDLVLTDPPYTDQVPYLEYSQLWDKVMGWGGITDMSLSEELVVSDAPSRNKSVDDFNTIFSEVIDRVIPSLKDGGYFIMFYHSFNLKSWSSIMDLMLSRGLVYCDQMPSAAPRKSFKTVMTPKGTLDGNYIVIFKKTKDKIKKFSGTIEDAKKMAIKCAKEIISEHNDVTSQDLYDLGMLKQSFEMGYISFLAEKYSTFIDVIADQFDFIDGVWRIK